MVARIITALKSYAASQLVLVNVGTTKAGW
jgi:hypothetical protein